MWVEPLPNGKYKFCERYTDFRTGKVRKVSITLDKDNAHTRKQAQVTLLDKIDHSFNKSDLKNNITLEMLINEYRKDQKMSVKAATYTRNYWTCNTLMTILGKDTLVSRLTAGYVRSSLLETGKAPGTLNEYLKRFGALIRYGYKHDLVGDISFLDKIDHFKDIPHRIKIEDKFLEADEVRRLLLEMKVEFWRDLTEFLVKSGLRFGEAAALDSADLDPDQRVIRVTKTYNSAADEITTPKTNSSIREVFIQDDFLPLCLRIRKRALANRMVSGKDYLFFNENHHRIQYAAYRKYLKENAEKSIGRDITPHGLRHTHASLLMENRVPIDVISRRLGHEDSKITREIYLHVTEKLKEKDNQSLASISVL